MTAVLTLLGGLVGLVPAVPAGASGAHECIETLPAGTYGNVSVSGLQSCVFEEGVTIEGNFKATSPVNIVTSGATIHGNVTIDGATGVVIINASQVVGSTTHIYGNVTIKNTDQSEISAEGSGLIYVGGEFLADEIPDDSNPFLFSTLHIHGDLSMKNNDVFDFFAGGLFSKLIVDHNVSVQGNVLSDLDLHVYSMHIGGNLTVKDNIAPAFTSVVCNNVEGNVTIDGNFNPGVDPGFEPPPGTVIAQLQVATNCADFIHPGIPIGNGTIGGNMTVRNNISGDGNNDLGQLAIYSVTVLGNLNVDHNDVNAVELLDSSFITVENSYVGGNFKCRGNNIDPIVDGFGSGPNVVIGNDKCFGD